MYEVWNEYLTVRNTDKPLIIHVHDDGALDDRLKPISSVTAWSMIALAMRTCRLKVVSI